MTEVPADPPDGGPGLRVTVVGGGVIGLTCALEVSRAGHRTEVWTAESVERTTSAVAAAIWSPYRAAPADDVLRWGATSLTVLTALADDPASGVVLMPGTVVHRGAEPVWWAPAVPGSRPATADELPAGAPAGTRCVVPVVDMWRYLPWLLDACRAAGVVVRSTRVDSLADVPGDVVVLAAGLRSGPLLGDGSGFPVQGQIVRLADPGLTEWTLDEENPGGVTYVVPRGRDVVCGGTAVEGAYGTEPDPAVERDVLERTLALVPALQGADVLSRAVGLRPGRPEVRLDRTVVGGRTVISCYGHGGAGVTLSWGCAADVVALT